MILCWRSKNECGFKYIDGENIHDTHTLIKVLNLLQDVQPYNHADFRMPVACYFAIEHYCEKKMFVTTN
jgi:hypothetical protein